MGEGRGTGGVEPRAWWGWVLKHTVQRLKQLCGQQADGAHAHCLHTQPLQTRPAQRINPADAADRLSTRTFGSWYGMAS